MEKPHLLLLNLVVTVLFLEMFGKYSLTSEELIAGLPTV